MKYIVSPWIFFLLMLSITLLGRASLAYDNNYLESKQPVTVTKQEKNPCGNLSGNTTQSTSQYAIFQFDNGDDYVEDGLYRIVDKKGNIGFANEQGETVIIPQFAFAFPFEDGKAYATCKGQKERYLDSEYHIWNSDEWFYIDKGGSKISDVFGDPFKTK